MDEELAYIYLIQDGNDRETYVYKIGRTIQYGDSRKIKRISNYSKGTVIHYTWKVQSEILNEIEDRIKSEFKTRFKSKRGTEWFEGNVHNMKKEIDNIIESYEQTGCTHHNRLFYDEDDPVSCCGNKKCNKYECYMSDIGKCLDEYWPESYCEECHNSTGFWDDRDKWQYCKNCTNFECILCEGSR